MRIVLLGLPGAGKGTQAAILAASGGVPHIGTGDMFRQAVAQGTELGQRVQDIMRRGALVPDDLTSAIVRQRLAAEDCGAGFVLDGFPRTVAQAEALDQMLGERGRRLDGAVLLVADVDTVVQRLSGRRVCPQCGATYHLQTDPPADGGLCRRCGQPVTQRADDTEKAQRQRIAVYDEATAPLIGFYQDQGKLWRCDGMGEVPTVTTRLRDLLAGKGVL